MATSVVHVGEGSLIGSSPSLQPASYGCSFGDLRFGLVIEQSLALSEKLFLW